MKIDILTLFPNMFENVFNESIIKRAVDKKLVDIKIHDIRDYTTDKHNRVDDYAFGGGKGMVLMPEPVYNAIEDVKTKDSIVIMMTPQGKTYNQKMAYQFSKQKHIIILCGHYEGFDERIKEEADEIVSVGDYILTGGEIGAMAIMDSVIRLVPGVINNESLDDESFNDGLLDYPVYTKPEEYRGKKVPSILLSGNHQKIKNYRHNERIRVTKEKRPDLLSKDV